tara:strand:- start:22409 stop:22753 length:345 start_codon:yes stop_codon:yes gene_type:complete
MLNLNSADSIGIVLTTESNLDNARILAHKILEKKFAACISFQEIKSIYWWKDKLATGNEIQLTIKTQIESIDKLIEFIKTIHNYENPELIFFNASSSNSYLNWIKEVTEIKDIL